MNAIPDSTPPEAVAAYVENELVNFAAAIYCALSAEGGLTVDQAKALLLHVDTSMKDNALYETHVPVWLLTPLYFETAAAINMMRGHLASEIGKAGGGSAPPTPA